MMFHQTDRVYYKTAFAYYQGFEISRPPLWYYFGTTHKVLGGYDLPLKPKREPSKVLRVVITRDSYDLDPTLLMTAQQWEQVRLCTFRKYCHKLRVALGSTKLAMSWVLVSILLKISQLVPHNYWMRLKGLHSICCSLVGSSSRSWVGILWTGDTFARYVYFFTFSFSYLLNNKMIDFSRNWVSRHLMSYDRTILKTKCYSFCDQVEWKRKF